MVDGEHCLPVLKWALEGLKASCQLVGAVFLGGTEKIGSEEDLKESGVPVIYGRAIPQALREAVDRFAPEVAVDLSDEPVVGYWERFQMASLLLSWGVHYAGRDFAFTPPRKVPTALPAIGVAGTGKRTGKTAVCGYAARILKGRWRVGIVTMGRVRPGDSLIFCCRRGEREIQLTRAFVDEEFAEFPRQRLDPLTFVPLTLYHPSLAHLPGAFAPQNVEDTLGEVISRQGHTQLRLAEKEKYAHVTYFFSGGRTEHFPGEVDRRVPFFLDDPPRSLPLLLSALENELSSRKPTLAVVNVATGDIVGHHEELEPKVRCAEEVDRALGAILKLAQGQGYWTAITADHGLLEEHGPKGGPPNVSHTTHPVPFLLVGPRGEAPCLLRKGILGDVAPTILELLDLPRPAAMSGHSLLVDKAPRAERALLVVLDGWGLGEPGHVNPIELARTPTWDKLSQRPMARLAASGEAVGLLPGRKGNSEAGHMNLGAGRIVPQDEVRIQEAIESGTFAKNPAFHQAIEDAQARGGALHLLGLLSEKSSHGSMDYVVELLKLARRKGCDRVFIRFITDGRSTQPGSAPDLLRSFGEGLAQLGVGTLVTLVGRGLALDRGGDYKGKTQRVYRALVQGEGIPVPLG